MGAIAYKGKIYGGGGNVEDLKDVEVTNIADGDILEYDSTAEKWKNSNALSNKVDKVAGKGLSTNDYTDSDKDLVATIPDKADSDDISGSKNVTGNPIIIEDSANAYAEEMIANIEPIQDLHGYDKPWVGGAGKNKFGNITWTQNGAIQQYNENTGILEVIVNDASYDGPQAFATFKDISNLLGKTVTFSITSYMISDDSKKPYIVFYADNVAIGNLGQPGEGITRTSVTFTIPNNTSKFEFLARVSQGSTSPLDTTLTLYSLLLEEGSTATTFEPYSNISPITGIDKLDIDGCGKNLFESAAKRSAASFSFSGITCTKDSRNVFKGSGTTTGSYGQYFFLASSDGGPIKAGSEGLFIKGAKTLSGIYYVVCVSETEDGAKQYPGINTTGYYVQPGYYIHQIYLQQQISGSAVSFEIEPQIEIGNQATDYEPYNGQIVSLQLGNKNLLPMTVEGIKAANTEGTWSGNVYTHNGVTYSLLTNSEGNIIGIKVNGTATASINFWLVKDYTFKPGSYIITDDCVLKGNYQPYVFVEGSTATNNANRSATYATNADIQKNIGIWMSTSSGANNVILYPMVRDANVTDSTFSPYNPALGGMVYDAVVDVTSGKCTAYRACKNIGELDFELYSADSTNHSFVVATPSDAKPVANNGTLTEAISSSYEAIVFGSVSHFTQFNSAFAQVINANRFIVRDVNYTSASAFKTAMASQQIVYELATPITYHLTPEQVKLLKGYNYITTNAEALKLTYQPDNVLGEVLGEAEGYTDRLAATKQGLPVTILDDVEVSTSSTQYTIPDISQFTMVQFVLTTCPAARVAYVRDTKTIPVSVLLHNIETYTYNHIITLLGLDPSTTDTWTECKIEMNSTTQISVSENSGASPDGGARLSIFAW